MKKIINSAIILFVFLTINVSAQDEAKILFYNSLDTADVIAKKSMRQEIIDKYPQTQYADLCKGIFLRDEKLFSDAVKSLSNTIEKYPDFDYPYYYRGLIYLYELNQPQLAEKDFFIATKISPYDPEFQYFLGRSLFENENLSGAIVTFSKTISISPKYFNAIFFRARSFWQNKQLELALVDCDTLLNNVTNDYQYYMLRGLIYYDLNNYSKAIEDFNSAIDLNNKVYLLYNFRANAYYQNEQFDLAKTDYITYKSQYPDFSIPIFSNIRFANDKLERKEYQKAINYYDLAMIESGKKSPEKILPNRAIAKKETGDTLGAIEDYGLCIKNLNPKFDRVERQYFDRGILYYSLKKYPEAESDFNNAIAIIEKREAENAKKADVNQVLFGKVEPENTSTQYLYLGLSQLNQNKTELGMENIDKACSIVSYFMNKATYKKNADDTLCFSVRAEVLMNKFNNYELAIKSYDKVISIIPDSMHTYILRGKAKEKAGRSEEAKLDFAYPLLVNARNERSKFNNILAINLYSQYLKMVKNNWEAYFERSQIYINNREFQLAQLDIDSATAINKTSYLLHSTRVTLLKSLNKYEEALQELTSMKSITFSDNNPKSSYLDNEIAALYEQMKQYSKAIDVYLSICKSDGYEYSSLRNISRLYYIAGDYSNSIVYFNKAIQQSLENNKNEHKNDHPLYYYYALSLHENGDSLLALVNIKNAIEISPNNELYHSQFNAWNSEFASNTKYSNSSDTLSLNNEINNMQQQEKLAQENAYYLNYKTQLSKALLPKKSGDYSGTLTNLTILQKTFPNSFDVYYWMSICQTKLFQYENALINAQKATALSPVNDSSIYLQGRIYMWLGKNDEAITSFNKAITINSKAYDYYYYRGIAYENKQDYASAITNFNTAIKVDQSICKAYSEIGYCYALQNQFAKAIEFLTSTIDRFPNETSPYLIRGFVHYKNKNYKSAIADFNVPIAKKDCSENDLINAYLQRGLCFYSEEYYNDAISDFSKVIYNDKNNATALCYRGICNFKLGNYNTSIPDFEKCTSITPKDPWPYYYLGRIVLDKNNNASAISYFSKAIKIDKSFADAYYFRGIAYHNQNVNSIIGQQDYSRDACDDWHTARSYGNRQAGSLIDKYCP